MNNNQNNYSIKVIKSIAGFNTVEAIYENFRASEMLPYTKNTPLHEVVSVVIPDRKGPVEGNEQFKTNIFLVQTFHPSTIGTKQLAQETLEYLNNKRNEYDMDIISVTAGIMDEQLCSMFIVRIYTPEKKGKKHDFSDIFDYIHYETTTTGNKVDKLIIPDNAYIKYDENYKQNHNHMVEKQDEKYQNASKDAPFLNEIDNYVFRDMPEIDDKMECIYDLKSRDMQAQTILPYDKFIQIFNRCMQYITSVEKDSYYNVIREKVPKETFYNTIDAYIEKDYINTGLLPGEDFHVLKDKLERALFQLYIVQDLIDDPDITDVKITSPDSIRVRVHGDAYLSNITFINAEDYIRFIQGIAVKNNVDLSVPTQTFTDESDPNYILRFSITAPYITGSGLPIIHIRKVSRKKLMGNELIKAGMFDEKIMNYLLDCGRYSRGVVFAGPPGSGKTVLLNWFLECAYESSAEILVIQENDELFSYRKGVMFEHVVNNPQKGEKACSLEDLGQLALVAGANVFVIGEAKGAEICSAITLSNSGCRTAITIHSPSSTETIDKMADLAMRGYAQSYEQAKRMIKSFQTIVYLQDFKVQEISEITGFNEQTKDMEYRYIYRRELEEQKKVQKENNDFEILE